MADLSHKLFRRTKAGDPVNKVLDTENLNFVYSVLEDIQGVYCRIEKPTDAGGIGWRIIFDPQRMDEKPADGKEFGTFRSADADVAQSARDCGASIADPSYSITLRDNEYLYDPSRYGESGRAEFICASSVYRLFGFRNAVGVPEVSGYYWGSGHGGTSSFALMRDAVGDTAPQLAYTEIAEAFWNDWGVDESLLEMVVSGTCGPMPYTLQLRGFASASGRGIPLPGAEFLLRRYNQGDDRYHLYSIDPYYIADFYEEDIEDEVEEELTSSKVSGYLSSLVRNLFQGMEITDSAAYGAASGDVGPYELWRWVKISESASNNFWEMVSSFNENLANLRSGLASAVSATREAVGATLYNMDESAFNDEAESADEVMSALREAEDEAGDALDDLSGRLSSIHSGLVSTDVMMSGFEARLSALEGV